MKKSQAVYFDNRDLQVVYDELYESDPDPWGHQKKKTHQQIDRALMYRSLSLLASDASSDLDNKKLLVEIGCGFGQNINSLEKLGFDVIGADVSNLALIKGREMYPGSELIRLDVTSQQFSDFLSTKNPDILFFCHVTWCIISKMDQIINTLKQYSLNSSKDIYFAHLTSIYPAGIQKLGADKFTNSTEFIQYLRPSEVIFEGEIWPDHTLGCALLLAKI